MTSLLAAAHACQSGELSVGDGLAALGMFAFAAVLFGGWPGGDRRR